MSAYLNHTRRAGTLAAALVLLCLCAAAIAQKARILVMLALTRTSDPKEIQRMFYTY